MIYLAECPFCGGKPFFERIGTNRVSCIISCTECGCRLESGESGEMIGKQWNTRPLGNNGAFIELQEGEN